MNSSLTTRSGFMSVEFYGSWSRYARLSSDRIWSCCHPRVSRRDGYDIECFITRHAEGEEAGDRRYRVRYFIPVTLSAAGLRSDSGSGSGLCRGEVKVAGATNIKAQTTAAVMKARHPHDGCQDGPVLSPSGTESEIPRDDPESGVVDVRQPERKQVASVTSTSCSGSRPTTACDSRPEVVRIATVAEPCEALSTSDSRKAAGISGRCIVSARRLRHYRCRKRPVRRQQAGAGDGITSADEGSRCR